MYVQRIIEFLVWNEDFLAPGLGTSTRNLAFVFKRRGAIWSSSNSRFCHLKEESIDCQGKKGGGSREGTFIFCQGVEGEEGARLLMVKVLKPRPIGRTSIPQDKKERERDLAFISVKNPKSA